MLKWVDNATYHGGISGNKVIEKGDIIPRGMIPDSELKRFIQYGKIIEITPVPVKPVKLSISVMAHPSRENMFSGLRGKLGDVPFSIDTKNNLVDNCKAAWLLHDHEADFHVVIQDDAIICNNFKQRAEAFISKIEAERQETNQPVYCYNFFVKKNYPDEQMAQFHQKGYYVEQRNRGGVAICLPVNQIQSMLDYYDTLTVRHDDERISQWIVKNKFRMCFPIPSLVDHDDHNVPSLAGNGIGLNRQAYKFIDTMPVSIPKIIHQLWIGPHPAPKKWMDTWKEKNPGWEYRLWTEKDIKETKWINQKHIDFYLKNEVWHGVSDVCTYEILYNHGGFMPGADAVCLLPIDELFKDGCDSYGCYEQEKIRPGLISPLLASVKGSKFALELIEGLHRLNTVGEPWMTTGNKYMGEMYKKTKHNVKIFPSHYFNPEHLTGLRYEGDDPVYAEQMWGTTKGTYSDGLGVTKPITLSISVMAHPSREKFFPYLRERLGEVPFLIDQRNNLLENSKAAWRMYNQNADFHCVIQDDCVVCDNFKDRAIAFITEQEKKRISEYRKPQGYNFFLKNADDGSNLIVEGDYHVDEWTRAGLSICLPTKLIDKMLVEFDKQKSRHDDDRISGFMRLNGYKMVFPFPSLIDHRIELDSLANNVVGLRAIKFIDDKNKGEVL